MHIEKVCTVVGFDRKINIPKGQWLERLTWVSIRSLEGLVKTQSAWCQPQSFGFSVVWVWAQEFAFLTGSWVMVVPLVKDYSENPCCRYFQQKEVFRAGRKWSVSKIVDCAKRRLFREAATSFQVTLLQPCSRNHQVATYIPGSGTSRNCQKLPLIS